MTYQVIARKWRPQTFDEVTGQDHVTTPLRNAIRSDRIPHALLLTGPRGVGKTTLARILARCLNCEKGPTETPCGSCDACEDITAGRSTDVQEIDAASRTGVDDVREVIESIRYAPSPGKHRIFVVDEVHMLSTAAFNALLKTLEEPPPRSLFVFATTNPEKIPFTVLSRCQRYDLRRISAQEVARSLGTIAEAEGVEISEQSLLALAREGEGSMRDSQTLLDQVISYGGSRVDDETVSQVLDLIDRNVLIAIAEACVTRDPKAALGACAMAIEKGNDPKRLGGALIQLFRDLVVLCISAADDDGLVEGSAEEIAALRELAGRSDALRLRRMFRILVKEQEDLAWAPQPFTVLEMALVRIASLPDGDDVAGLIARLEALEKRLGPGDGPVGGGNASGTGGDAPTSRGGAGRGEPSGGRGPRASAAGPIPVPDPDPNPNPTPRRDRDRDSGLAVETPVELAVEAPVEPAVEAPVEPAAEDVATPEAVMDRLIALARKENPGLAQTLRFASLAERSADSLHFRVPGHFHRTRLEDRQDDLARFAQRFFGKPMRIRVTAESEAIHDAPAPPQRAEVREAERKRKHAALNHPAVNMVLRELKGEIVEIRPLGSSTGESR